MVATKPPKSFLLQLTHIFLYLNRGSLKSIQNITKIILLCRLHLLTFADNVFVCHWTIHMLITLTGRSGTLGGMCTVWSMQKKDGSHSREWWDGGKRCLSYQITTHCKTQVSLMMWQAYVTATCGKTCRNLPTRVSLAFLAWPVVLGISVCW